MNNKKRLILNCIIISIFISCIYYFGGYYISKNKCITDRLKVLNREETYIPLMSFMDEEEEVSLLNNVIDSSYIFITIKQYGPFYKTEDHKIVTPQYIDEDISLFYFISKEKGFIFFAHIKNKNIEKFSFSITNGPDIEWTRTYSDTEICTYASFKDNYDSISYCKAYDKDNKVIKEIQF